MDCSTPSFPVFHCLLELAQTHVHRVSDAIQTPHPLSSPSSPALSLSQHQGIFKWEFFTSGGQSLAASAAASVLSMNIQCWFPLGLTCSVFLQSGDSQESSAAPQFKSINSSVLSLLYGPTLISIHDFWKNHRQIFFSKAMSLLFNTLSRFVIAFLPKSKCLYLPISPDKFL